MPWVTSVTLRYDTRVMPHLRYRDALGHIVTLRYVTRVIPPLRYRDALGHTHTQMRQILL